MKGPDYPTSPGTRCCVQVISYLYLSDRIKNNNKFQKLKLLEGFAVRVK